jgi:hypothetical protein
VKEGRLKGYTMYDSIYVIFWKKQNCWDRKLINGHQELGVGRDEELFCILIILIMLVITYLYMLVKTQDYTFKKCNKHTTEL